MSIGMSYEEYWYGDVRMAGAFLEAERLRKKQRNTDAWIQGLYVYEAVARLAPIFRFGVKHPKPIDYMDKPYDLYSDKKDKEEEEKRKDNAQYAENERLRAILYLKQWAKANQKTSE